MSITKEELDKLLEVRADIEKVTTVSSDGRNLLTRIPKKIIDELKLKKGNKLRWLVDTKKSEIHLTIEKNNDNTKKEKHA